LVGGGGEKEAHGGGKLLPSSIFGAPSSKPGASLSTPELPLKGSCFPLRGVRQPDLLAVPVLTKA